MKGFKFNWRLVLGLLGLGAFVAYSFGYGVGEYMVAMAVVGTPGTLDTKGATGLRRVAWEKRIREKSIIPSVFTDLQTKVRYDGQEMIMEKSGVFLEVSPAAVGEGQSVRMAMTTPFRKRAVMGADNDALGSAAEDELGLLWTELKYNEIKKPIKYRKLGYYYNDTEYLGFVERHGPAIIEYMKELRDTRIHQALLLRVADELLETPTSMSQQFNPNWVIPNLAETSYPSWDKDAPTRTAGAADSDGYYSSASYAGATSFAENIAASLIAASGTGSTPKGRCDVEFLLHLEDYLLNEMRMPPVPLDGDVCLPLLVPNRVLIDMLNPNVSGSLGAYWKDVAQYKGEIKRPVINYEVGKFGRLLLLRDPRYMTVTVGGSAGAYTLVPGFMQPGGNDDRNKSAWSNESGATNFSYDLITALGENAVAEMIKDPLIPDLRDQTEYGMRQGRMAYLGSGMQQPWWDKDSGSQLDGASKTLEYTGSAMIPVARRPRVTVV